jgi:hypothetical protein
MDETPVSFTSERTARTREYRFDLGSFAYLRQVRGDLVARSFVGRIVIFAAEEIAVNSP